MWELREDLPDWCGGVGGGDSVEGAFGEEGLGASLPPKAICVTALVCVTTVRPLVQSLGSGA